VTYFFGPHCILKAMDGQNDVPKMWASAGPSHPRWVHITSLPITCLLHLTHKLVVLFVEIYAS